MVIIVQKDNINDLNRLKRFIDCDWYLENDIPVQKYYKINKLAYRFFHSKSGFMHMSISINDQNKKGKLYQPETVSDYIKEGTKSVLELGCGQGANIRYLAEKHPNVHFIGVDLVPSIGRKLKNVMLIKNDYHCLDKIPSNSQDIVYSFEALCYSMKKDQIFKEVNRILKSGGVFIIFDGYSKTKREDLSNEDREIAKLIEKGMVLNEFEYVENISKYAKHNHFEKLVSRDLSEYILPNMKQFRGIVEFGMKFGIIFKTICKILPKAFVGNAITGYFMKYSIENNIFCYMEQIYKKI